MKTVLITRAADDGEKARSFLEQQGLQVLHIPLIRIMATCRNIPDSPCDALIVTSAHAAPFLEACQHLKNKPVFAVGEKTASAVVEMGFQNIFTGQGTALELAELIRKHMTYGGHLLHVTGEDHKEEPRKTLKKHGFSYETWLAYKAAEICPLPPELEKCLLAHKIDIILHYSRRSAALFRKRVLEANLLNAVTDLTHIFISQDAACGIPELQADHVLIAQKPDEAHMLEKTLMAVLLQN